MHSASARPGALCPTPHILPGGRFPFSAIVGSGERSVCPRVPPLLDHEFPEEKFVAKLNPAALSFIR